jgi:hypothetical protein
VYKNKIEILSNYIERYDDKFSIKKIALYRNKKKLALKFAKKKIKNLFSMWNDLPFSLLIFISDFKYFRDMSNYLYSLHDYILIKKHRRIYIKKNNNKLITGFNTYRIYCSNFLKLYDNIEDIIDYEINILGIEINNILYPIEEISNFFKTIKEDLKYIFNILNDYNKQFNNIFSNFNSLDHNYNQNIQEIFTICPHIIKLDAEKE